MTFLAPPHPIHPGLKIGILGGSFNPAHEGHLYISEVALKKLGLDHVWWLVSPGNPLKDPASMAPLSARMKRAGEIAKRPDIHVSALEKDLGTVYTVETLTALKARFHGVHFCWLMGSDNLMQFDRWRSWQRMADMVPIVVVMRPGTELAPVKARAMARLRRIRPDARAKRGLILLDGQRNQMSATTLRREGLWNPAENTQDLT